MFPVVRRNRFFVGDSPTLHAGFSTLNEMHIIYKNSKPKYNKIPYFRKFRFC